MSSEATHWSSVIVGAPSRTCDRTMAANIGQCSSELLGCPGPDSSDSGASGLLPAIASTKSKSSMAENEAWKLMK